MKNIKKTKTIITKTKHNMPTIIKTARIKQTSQTIKNNQTQKTWTNL